MDLLDTLPGTSLLLARNPDVPFYPMGLSWFGRKLVVNIGEPFTYNQIAKVGGKKRRSAEIDNIIIESIAAQIADPKLKAAWTLQQKWGFTREQIEEAQRRDPNLGAAVSLLERFPPAEGVDPVQDLKEMDEAAIFAA